MNPNTIFNTSDLSLKFCVYSLLYIFLFQGVEWFHGTYCNKFSNVYPFWVQGHQALVTYYEGRATSLESFEYIFFVVPIINRTQTLHLNATLCTYCGLGWILRVDISLSNVIFRNSASGEGPQFPN